MTNSFTSICPNSDNAFVIQPAVKMDQNNFKGEKIAENEEFVEVVCSAWISCQLCEFKRSLAGDQSNIIYE